MKTIGLIGGMSWESTVTYYQIINETVRQALGGLHSAKCLLCSVDFHEIEAFHASGAWEQSGEVLADEVVKAEPAGFVKEWKINGEAVAMGVEKEGK